jgi:single-stranded-DNA-specific exonuclease
VVARKVWEFAEPAPGRTALARELGVSETLARLLIARGLTDARDARRFLAPSLAAVTDPFLLPGMSEAVRRLSEAARDGERIVVYGDFDADGMTSAVLLSEALQALGADARAFIPDRFEEGYGLTADALARVAEETPDLIVTVDCGVTAVAEAEECRRRGMDLIITDHHGPGPELPAAVAVIDPKLPGVPAEAASPLAGVGVAFKLAWALLARAGLASENLGELDPLCDAPLARLLDLVAVGTVADVVDLLGENRELVVAGLARLNGRPRPGLAALVQSARLPAGSLGSEHVAFGLAPRLNAAARLGKTEPAMTLLATEEPELARRLAGRLDSMNRERQVIGERISREAQEMAQSGVDEARDRVIVLSSETWHDGVKGIVASRLVERYFKPTLLFTVTDGVARGSARSIPGVDIHELLGRHRELYSRFGGHAGAAGLSLPAEALPDLAARLAADLSELPATVFVRRLAVDAEVSPVDLERGLAKELPRLAPHGAANPAPVLAIRECEISGQKRVGDGSHLKFTVRKDGRSLPAIAFRLECIDAAQDHGDAADVAFTLERDEWMGRQRTQLRIVDLVLHGADEDAADDPGALAATCADRRGGAADGSADGSSAGACDGFLERLFEQGRALCADEDYANIGDEDAFFTKVVGVTFDGRQAGLEGIGAGDPLTLRREPDNPHDPNAVAVDWASPRAAEDGPGDHAAQPGGAPPPERPAAQPGAAPAPERPDAQIGYLNARLARQMAPLIDDGVPYRAEVASISGGGEGQSKGVNILLVRRDREEGLEAAWASASAARRELEAMDVAAREEAIRRALLGDSGERPCQTQALDLLRRGLNTLVVMGTGRGKSFVFQARAAQLALEGKTSLFVYPLRALANDQEHSMGRRLAGLGIRVAKFTGELAPDRRAEAFEALASGRVDIAVTTPEFLSLHRDRLACGTIAFVVIDEAHHVARATRAHRPAYLSIGEAIEALGSPVVLACSATCGDKEAVVVRERLRIDELVVDRFVRENLHVVDKRSVKDKHGYLRRLAGRSEKTVIYVNSRELTVDLAEHIRSGVPGMAERVGFYHGGLGKELRHEVETRFRESSLTCVVATSAFGEGIDVPDVRHVVLFHLPFSEIDYNQQSGRAGRDDSPAAIHLLFEKYDAKLNRMVLDASSPGRDLLAELYRTLRDLASDDGVVERAWADIAAEMDVRDRKLRASASSVGAGVRILEELGLADVDRAGSVRRVRLLPAPPEKLDLESSVRFAEGLEEKRAFETFSKWAFATGVPGLRDALTRPIAPSP